MPVLGVLRTACSPVSASLSSATQTPLQLRRFVRSITASTVSPSSSSFFPSCPPLPAKTRANVSATLQAVQQLLGAGRQAACNLGERCHVRDPSETKQRSAAAQPQAQQPSSQLMIITPLHPPPAALCLPICAVQSSQSVGASQCLFAFHCSVVASAHCAVALLTAQPLPLSALEPAGLTPHAVCLQLSEAQLERAKDWMHRTMAAVVKRAAVDRQRQRRQRREYLLVPVLRDETTAGLSVDWATMSHSLWSNAPRLARALTQCAAAEQTSTRSARSRVFLTPLLQLLRSLPLVLYRLESQLQALSFLQSARLPDSFLPLTLTALTSRHADQSAHYERLEFLGDAFIKLAVSAALVSQRPAAQVEELTEARVRLSSNARLGDLGLQHGLLDCIRARPFSPLKMAVAGVTDAASEPLSRDILADAVEATVAACYLQGGEQAAQTVMERLGLPCRLAPPAPRDFDLAAVCLALSPAQSQRVHDFLSFSVPAIESRLEYRFQSPFLLLSAFCHPSCELPLEHRRLAFVGEAAADFLISERLFLQPAAPQPGEMTEMRQRLVGLDAYGRLLQRLSLHSHILCAGEQLNSLQRWRREEAEVEAGRQSRWLPRLLSDVMKSLLGAVLVDSGMQTESVRRLWQRVAEQDWITR